MNKELIKKVIDLRLTCLEKENNFYIKYLSIKIKAYEEQLKELKKKKPLWFQKTKLKKYYQKLKEYDDIIYDTYVKLAEEIDSDSKF